LRLLFITSTRIGDAVLSTGVLSSFIHKHPGIKVTIACGPDAAPIFEGVPNLDRILVVRKMRYSLHWLALWSACALHFWHTVVDLRRSALSYFLLAGRRYILGRGDEKAHMVAQIAQGLGLEEVPGPLIWTRPAHEAMAQDMVGEGPPVLAVAPTANWRGKQWSTQNFIDLIKALTGPDGILPGARVAILGAPGDRTAAEPVIISVPVERRMDLVGKVDLLTTFAFLRHCAFFVGNDSGLMHLAAASGVPTLGLFGPSRVENYGPWGDNSAVARTAIPYDELINRPGYDHRTTKSLMESLTVDMVIRAARELWSRSPHRAA